MASTTTSSVLVGLSEVQVRTFTRPYRIDRSLTPLQTLARSGFEFHTNLSEYRVNQVIPIGPTEGEMTFFNVKLSHPIDGDEGRMSTFSDEAVLAVYDQLGLVSHPLAQLSINDADRKFPKEYLNACVWKYSERKGCFYLTFEKWGTSALSELGVDDRGGSWGDLFQPRWFGGIKI